MIRMTWMMMTRKQYGIDVLRRVRNPPRRCSLPCSPLLRQGKGNDVVAAGGAQGAVPSGGDHHELPMIGPGAVGHRRRLAAGGEAIFPQLAPGLQVESAEVAV